MNRFVFGAICISLVCFCANTAIAEIAEEIPASEAAEEETSVEEEMLEEEMAAEEMPADEGDCVIPAIAEHPEETTNEIEVPDPWEMVTEAYNAVMLVYSVTSSLCDYEVPIADIAQEICEAAADALAEQIIQPYHNQRFRDGLHARLDAQCPDNLDNWLMDEMAKEGNHPEYIRIAARVDELWTILDYYEAQDSNYDGSCIEREIERLQAELDAIEEATPQRRQDLSDWLSWIFGVEDGNTALDTTRIVSEARDMLCEPPPAVAEKPEPTAEPEPLPEETAEPTPTAEPEPLPEETAEPTPTAEPEPMPEETAEPAPTVEPEPTTPDAS